MRVSFKCVSVRMIDTILDHEDSQVKVIPHANSNFLSQGRIPKTYGSCVSVFYA